MAGLPVIPVCDILGLGCVAVDEILYVASYPPADSKAEVLRRERHCGGLTATALVAAARLGARCRYASVLGQDDLSRFAIDRLAQEGIDLTYLKRREDARPISAVIVVDTQQGTRNIFFDLHGVVGADPAWPDEAVIRAARVLFVDHIGVPGMLRAARIAREARIPIVADFEGDDAPEFPALLDLVDHLILSREFAARVTGADDPATAVRRLWTSSRAVAVVTDGANGCWALTAAAPSVPRHYPAFRVEAVDTTGCGDVFHGGYAAGLAQGLDMDDRIRFAAAAAALKATGSGGQATIPTRAEVEEFLKVTTYTPEAL